ncbi:hypothetical protein CFK37_02035 [Virgibacillus phasianinus]|uniref:Uncharacterized protein n=1 Tax=Virgibacillus phasianinus TaxID=2017483 RepID=A0A220TZH6_9BACI|nr:hypothetical protein [Virgibacillus phasianinus]ASK61061.1 hypothetical protein CFK37_02035 [Virgibacillus phasianinus]
MNRQIKGLLYFCVADAKRSLLIFWTILIGFVTLGVLIALFLMTGENDKMIMSIPFAVYIYSSIFGFLTVKQSIPFAIKMGATRKNLFIGLAVFLVGLSIFQAILINIIQSIYEFVCQQISIDAMEFMSLGGFLDNTWLTSITVEASVIFFIMTLDYMLGLLFYKYGLPGGGGILGVALVMLLYGFSEGFLIDFANSIIESFDIMLFFEVAGIGFLIYILSWGMVRKITIE